MSMTDYANSLQVSNIICHFQIISETLSHRSEDGKRISKQYCLVMTLNPSGFRIIFFKYSNMKPLYEDRHQ